MNNTVLSIINLIRENALNYCEIAKMQGFLALQENLDEERLRNKEVLEYGLLLKLWCTDDNILLNTILTNIVNKEEDRKLKQIKTLEKDIVLNFTGITKDIINLLIDSIFEIDKSIYNDFINKWYFNK